jgi:hypothetical protein
MDASVFNETLSNWTFWVSILGYGLGFAILAYALLAGVIQVLSLPRRRRFNLLHSYDRKTATVSDGQINTSMSALLGLDHIPWLAIYLGGATISFSIYLPTRQFWALLLALLPFLYRMGLTRYRQRRLMQAVWQFMLDLRVRLTLRGTLLLAMQDVARNNPSPIARALQKYLDAGLGDNGMTVLERLDKDVPGLPFLSDLVARTNAAQEGTLDLDQALRQVMESLQQEMKTISREQLQKIPSRLILMAFPALLMPALFVLVFPLAARLIASLQGLGF